MEVNGTLASLNTGNSVFIGQGCGTNDDFTDNRNVAVGYRSLLNNTSGTKNVALGVENLLNNTTGGDNIAIGDRSLRDNTTGGSNIAMGFLCLANNSTGGNNVGLGTRALNSNTAGNHNIAIGYASMGIGNGSNNIALGRLSMQNTSSSNNIGIGQEALLTNTSGSDNVAIGVYSLRWTGTGTWNTAIGYRASGNYGDPSNSTTLGAYTNHAGSNTVRIGNNVSSIGGPEAWTNYSDARFKRNVRENVVGLDFILGLRPVTYNFDYKAINRHQKGTDTIQTEETYKELEEIVKIGFLAQEVEALADSLEFHFHGVDKPRFDEDVYGLRYSEFVPSLVKAIQEQQKHIQAQQVQIKQLNKRIETLEKK